jgi:hypothetical protein
MEPVNWLGLNVSKNILFALAGICRPTSTVQYLQVTNRDVLKIISPLDELNVDEEIIDHNIINAKNKQYL